MKINRIIIIAAIIVTVIAAATAVFYSYYPVGYKKLVLWTDNPEMISYVEKFNSLHETIKIETIYKQYPARELMSARRAPDMVIGSYLNSPQVIDNFRKLNHLFRKDRIDKNSFYHELLRKGEKSGRQHLLPVSFNMPALMFRRGDVSYDISSFVLTDENIREISKSFNASGSRDVSAFSPRWNSGMLYYNAVMSGADFRTGNTGRILFSTEGIENSLEKTRNFIKEINGGFAQDKSFEEKHLYRTAESLISEQRIFFSYTDLREFYAMGQHKRNGLNFRWLATGDKIPVSDEIIYAGIPRQAQNRRGAELFLLWFFSYDSQASLMEEGKTKRIRSFGLASGFSSIRAINEEVFPRHYPLLVGHIPPSNMLSFPEPLPVEWELLKNDVVKPWLYAEAGNEKTMTELSTAISNWYRIHPGY